MNKLEQLIQELCPHGVEYKKLGEVCKVVTGGDVPNDYVKGVNSKTDKYCYAIYSNGTEIYGYSSSYKIASEAVTISSIGNVGFVAYREAFFTPIIRLKTVICDNQILNTKFLYYYLSCLRFVGTNSSLSSMKADDVKKIMLPVPPLEIQKEIVRILDTFTELEKELEKELEARKKQYEFYREQLFTFDSGVNWSKLKELAVIGTGSSNTNEEVENGIYPFYVRSQDVRRKNSYEFDETAIITAGDGVGVGKVFHYVEGKYALHQRAYRIVVTSDKLFPKFFFYFMKNTFLSYITNSSFHSSVTSIRKPMLENYLIPLPPLEEQERIVNILDRFDALCNDLTCGLPAEIEARRKQYAYYRDKLLTFKNIAEEV